MSADNGIVMLKSPKASGGCEYRVREVHALDNMYARNDSRRLDSKIVVAAFAQCPVLDEEAAKKAAADLKREINASGQIVEFGIIQLLAAEPFPVQP